MPFLSAAVPISLKSACYTPLNKEFDIFGFHSHHSTETALVNVVNDLLLSGDSGNLSIPLLLNLSSAFDTVCHKILLSRLSEMGVSGAAFSWFSSCLTEGHYYIAMHNYKFPTALLRQGFPQGSVLSPLLYYIMPLGHITCRYGFNYHCYAEDIQINIYHKTTSPSMCLKDTAKFHFKFQV
ncbi:putative RNA-directed DNA polymerase from transposon BS [Labeo rohita]|uniref:RNA-directed DNA polymerase from transposon BS n=1 Tax=Labeo rohita TaxID=84645 RepID=A0ABQ8M3F6_LABRO|nr:putative RNA-directed DNA polymerase from transposon BS [Labeo rohita]